MSGIRNLYFLIVVITLLEHSYSMTRAQVKKTMTVMKNQCLPKTGVAEGKVAQIEQGVFIEERDVMCYVTCIYKTAQVVKNGKLDKDLISKQIDILYPKEMREPTKSAVAQCIQIQDKYSDSCASVFFATKCLYEADPSNFIFP